MSVLTTGPPSRLRTASLVVTPAVVAHRGASGYRPEHTLDAYRTAIRLGADAIELDVVPTADGVLLARHENELSLTTDVAAHPELADRRTTKVVDGETMTGWFAEDLTLAEVKTLAARERRPGLRPGNTVHDGREGVPTLNEVLAMVGAESVRRGRAVGVLVELKSPPYFDALGLSLDEPLLADLRRHGLDHARSRVTLMSFDGAVLRRLARRTLVPLVQLLDVGDPVDGPALDAIEEYADAIGVHQDLVLPRTADGALDEPTRLVRDAHRRWLDVYVWTLRAENHYLPTEHRVGDDPAGLGDLRGLADAFLDAGVDGLITDHPDLAIRAVVAAA
ncbi:glycerophosphodiester phosphodiesterase family protein [Nocardioides lianchengensis]|uniref:glycerophosphodiester phosphodiesterase n=1 Tax=Nocardioides lianchengensis TaxID=1045774 RepID=A0A1G6IRS1_9ACTN|nr:glycerophosphodiester phosphodiesterase family protein [Nocardioides lianchengensis]NYG12963.1 glycerophosphoryl diester phosphodiesterase [Nocardioides lianchengensis]SDC09178.1 glycerophosphoryl diester phosphodiesterase [Nocardioides lianchengensis]